MKLAPQTDRRGLLAFRLLLALLACASLPLLAYATAPSWWPQRGVLVVDATADDYAVANQGQLKNIARAAVAELEDRLPGGAGDALRNLVAGWSAPGEETNDFAPVNLGQLKSVAKPFHDRLIAVRYADQYPWVGSAAIADDYAVANLGQVKNLFSFDLLATDPARDTDRDALPDWWERFYFGNTAVDPNAPAARGDGVTNLQAFQQGLHPIDYYNGQRPNLTIQSGGNQQSAAGSFLPLPLVIKVTGAANQPLANAPVIFTVTSGGGALAADPSSATARVLELRTGVDGTASASYQQPNAPAITSQVTASAGTPAQRSEAVFTALTQESQGSNTLEVAPEHVDAIVNAGQSSTIPVTLTNRTSQPLPLAATVENGTFRDSYHYRDSDQAGGPAFVWNDISTTGRRLEDVSNGDDRFESFNLSFPFPYFDQTYRTVFVSSNGYVTFGAGSTNYSTYAFPDPNLPANEIAAFHNDLHPGNSGDIYYLEEADRVIIQFENVARYSRDGFATFQIVLQRDGTIFFYYKEMVGTVDRATVGLQNATQDEGLSIAYEQTYLKNNLAVRISNVVAWLTISPASGSLAAGESATLNLLLDAQELENGAFGATARFNTGASPDSTTELPVSMTVNTGPEVSISFPSEGWAFIEGSAVVLQARAEDRDGVTKVEFYDGAAKIGEALSAPFTATLQNLSSGVHQISARAVDGRGAMRASMPVAIDVQSDSNGNGMGDAWELRYFGNLDQPASGDFDGDGADNATEFARNLNPTQKDTDADGVSDGDEVYRYGTDPRLKDTDGDGMHDAFEIAYGLDPFRDDSQADADGDGLTNLEEAQRQTNPNDRTGGPVPSVTIGGNEQGGPIVAQLARDQTITKPLILKNPTSQDVTYSVAPVVLLNHEATRYSFVDSKNGELEFIWEEISATGTRLNLVSGADDSSEPVSFSNFVFPFYGQSYSQVQVTSNGYLTFGPPGSVYNNESIPSAAGPNLLVAVFWDDLLTGDVYYKEEADRLIIQYTQVRRYSGDGTFTFQIVLFAGGAVEFRYLTVTGPSDSCTVGIENAGGTDGVQVAVNDGNYLQSNLRVRLKAEPYVEVSPSSGLIPANSSVPLDVIFRASDLPAGTYIGPIQISHDGPGTKPLAIDAVLQIINLAPAAAITSPAGAVTIPEGEDVELVARVSDPDSGIRRVEFEAGPIVFQGEWRTNSLGFDVVASGTFPLGVHTVVATATDDFGLTTRSQSVTVNVVSPDADEDNDGLTNSQEFDLGTNLNNPDTDGDGIPDGWEVRHGLYPLGDDAGGDLDGDEQTNLQEFQNGTDPNDFFNGIPPVITVVQGGDQSGTAGNFNYSPITVEVRNSAGVLLANAPVTYTITQGSGTLSLIQTANPPGNVNSLSLRADANGRASVYFMPTGAIGSTYQIAVNGSGTGTGGGGPSATGSNLDPNGDHDGDGKTNGEEGKLGTNPIVFNLFAETHYAGHAETPHTGSNPLPWVFYTEPLTGAPEGWEGMPLKAAVVFDSGGTQNNWVVDDYASINDQLFVKLGYDLIYDVSEKWNATGSNVFTATSDVQGGVYCSPFKVILSVEVEVDIQMERLAGAGAGLLLEEKINSAFNENSPGAQVLANNDDDDMNGQRDSSDTGRVVQPENDMNRLSLSVSSDLKAGRVILRVESTVGGISLKIWKDLNNKVADNLLLSGGVSPVEKVWDLANESQRQELSAICAMALWVEALGSDNANQVTGLIKLTYEPIEGPQNTDRVKVSVPPAKRYTLTVAQNVAASESALSELIHDSEEVLRRDDDGDQGNEDRQCAIGFAKGTLTPDNTNSLASINFDDEQQVDAVYARMSQLGVNTYITSNGTGGRDLLGFARIGSGRIVVEANTGDQSLIAHEWGHALGLDHRDTAPNAVMYRSGGTMVNEAEANVFLGQ